MEYENELSDFMYWRIQFLNIGVNFVFLGGLKRYWGGLKSNLLFFMVHGLLLQAQSII